MYMTMSDYTSQPRWWQRSAQAVASSRYGSKLTARLLPRIDRTVLRLSGNRFTFSSVMTDTPVVMLTTTGAKSGLPRTVPLLADRRVSSRLIVVSLQVKQ